MPETKTNPPALDATLRRTDIRDAEGILAVINSAFPTWPSVEIDVPAIEHLRWKMSPPHPWANQHSVVEQRGTIVGVQLRWPGRGHVRGQEHPIDYGTDLSIHSSVRGQGLASRLRDAETDRRAQQGQSIGFDTVSSNQQVNEMYRERGYVFRPLTVWARPLDARAFLATHRRGGIAHLGRTAFTAGVRRFRSQPSVATGQRVERITAFDDRATELWDRVRTQFEFARIRDAAWLNWRYLDPRAGTIEVYGTYDGDRLLGYVAIRHSARAARILDLVTDPEAAGVGAGLLEHAVAELRQSGCRAIECLLPSPHHEEQALREAGFLPTAEVRPVRITRTRHTWLPEIIEIMDSTDAPIHVMFGDLDHA